MVKYNLVIVVLLIVLRVQLKLERDSVRSQLLSPKINPPAPFLGWLLFYQFLVLNVLSSSLRENTLVVSQSHTALK